LFLLDTDHWTILQLKSGKEFETLVGKITSRSPEEFFVSIVTFHEVMTGWLAYLAKAKGLDGVVRGYHRLDYLFGRYEPGRVLAFDEKASEIFGELRASKIRIGTMDLRIASIALANQLTVITRNRVDFERVPGLPIEDWLA
jgi:tRNA(fMet)-specific endonuclease VapC